MKSCIVRVSGCNPYGFDHADSACDVFSRDIKGRSMVDACAEKRKSERERNSPFEVEGFAGYVTLIVVEGQSCVKASDFYLMEYRISADRADCPDAFLSGSFDCGLYAFFLVPEKPVLAAMGIKPCDCDQWIGNSEPCFQGPVAADKIAVNSFFGDKVARFPQ